MDADTLLTKAASPVTGGENKKPKDVDTAELTSPPMKKMKQARLPFKVLTPKPATSPGSVSSSQKKRKLSDPQADACRQAKTPKNDNAEDTSNKTNDDPENQALEEVNKTLMKKSTTKSKPSKLLDCFVGLTHISTKQDSTHLCCDNHVSGKEVTVEQVSNSLLSSNVRGDDGIQKLDREQCHEKKDENLVTPAKVGKLVANNASTSEVDNKSTGDNQTENSESLDAKKEPEASKVVIEGTDDLKCHDSSIMSEADMTAETNSDNSQDDANMTALDSTDVSGSSSLNSSTNSCDVSKDDGTPTCKVTPKSSRTGSGKPRNGGSSRKKDPEKEKAKELARLEREKAKAEKIRQQLEAKAKRKQERLEAKRKKEEERLRLQKEREEKLQQKEEERKKRQLEKEEEKRKRQELIDAKNEEKKKKDEERLKAEEELKLKKEKEKALFTKFFTKADKQPQPAKSEEEKMGPFIAFEVKDNMRLAPVFRVNDAARQEKAANVEKVINNQQTSVLYLDELKQKSYRPGHATKTWPLIRDVDVEVIPDNPTYHLRAKLLQFHENYRPAYYGTWRKCSRLVNPRNPLRKDEEIFDYEVDSDEEWEEEEPGESLSHSEGEASGDEKDDAADDDVDDDGFFVPHGYLSEGEGCEDEDDDDISPERLKARQLAKAKAWEADMKRKKLEVLKPVCIGCLWSDMGEVFKRDPDWERLQQYTAVPLVPTPISFNVVPENETLSLSSKRLKLKTRLLPVPKEAIPDLIRLLHGNTAGINKLIREFREYWCKKVLGKKSSVLDSAEMDKACDNLDADVPQGPVDDDIMEMNHSTAEVDSSQDLLKEKNAADESSNNTGVKHVMSKRQLSAMIRILAVYEKRVDVSKKCCWYVHKDELEKYNLTDLPVPNKWQWLTQPKIKHASRSPSLNGEVASGEGDTSCAKKQSQPPSSHNIKQFAVAGYTPPVHQSTFRTKTTPGPNVMGTPKCKVNQGTPNTETPTRRKAKQLTPSALFSPGPGHRNNTDSITPGKADVHEVKPRDNTQRTLVSMFSPDESKPVKRVNSVTESIQSPVVDDKQSVQSRMNISGFSTECPIEID